MTLPGAGVAGRFSGGLGAFRLEAEFTLAPQGITALSGPSGSGKSSLMRCIAGLARLPGRLVVDGEVWQDEGVFLPVHRRAVGVVFQDASLLSHLSVRANLLYGARRASGTAELGLDDVVDLLGLAPLMARATTHLSGGERQRVALGRALLSRPRLLLMDEPLSSLDAASKAEILPYLESVHRSLAMPMLYISHDAGEIARLADHVLFMRDGRILPPDASELSGLDLARRQLGDLDAAERDRLALAAILAGLEPQG
jgi:molybdate transport system ATP-binding protein